MGRLTDPQYNQRVWRLLAEIGGVHNDDQARQLLLKQMNLLSDRRFLPTLFQIFDAALQRSGATGEALAYYLAALAHDVLLELPPARIGRGGAVTLLMASDDLEVFRRDGEHLRSILDDAFFNEFGAMRDDARQRGLTDLAEGAETRMRLAMLFLTLARLDELHNEMARARSVRAAFELIVKAARTAPRWFVRGLELALEELKAQSVPEFEMTLIWTLQRALQALAAGHKPDAIIKTLEADTSLQRYIQYCQMPRPESAPDMLAVYGEKEKRRLIEMAGQVDRQMQSLFKFALAEDEEGEWQAIADEPTVLSQEAERRARRTSADAAQQKQFTLSEKMLRAAERIRSLLTEFAKPEQNIIAQLAAQVRANELTLDDALARLSQTETLHGLTILHLAAMDEQATRMYHSGNLREAEVIGALNHAAAQKIGNLRLRADVNISLAEIKSELGKHHEAVPLLQEAEQLAQQIGDQQRLIRAVGTLGTAYQELDDYENAIKCYERALEIARAANLASLEVAALGNLAGVNLLMGNLNAALTYSEQALQKAHASGDSFQIAQGLSTRALVLHQAARYDEAIALYHDALRAGAVTELRDVASEIRIRSHLGQALAEIGKTDQALVEMEKALTLAQTTGNLPLEAGIISALGSVYSRRGDLSRALAYFEQALTIERSLGLREKQAILLLNVANIQMSLKQFDFAKQALDQAHNIAREIHNPRLEAQVGLRLADYFGERGEWQQSESAARKVWQLAQKLGYPDAELSALGTLGRALELQGRLEEAAQCQSQVLARARQLKLRMTEARALLNLGVAQAKLNDHERALETLTTAARAASELGLTSYQYYAHYNLGLLYASALNDLPRALEHYYAAIQSLEQERAVLGEIEEFEQRYIVDKQHVYRLAAEILLKLNQPLEALETLEQGRARLLTRRLTRREALPPGVPEELRARYTRTVEAVQFFRKIIYGEPTLGMKIMDEVRRAAAELRHKPIDEEKERQGYKQGLAEAEAELAQIIESIRTYIPNFGGMQTELPRLDFAEIVRDPTAAVVALFIGGSGSCAIVLHPAGTRVVDLPNLKRGDVEYLLNVVPEPLAQLDRQVREQMPKMRTPNQIGYAVMYMHYMTLRLMIEEADSFEIGWQKAVQTLITEKTQADQLERIRRNLRLEPREKTLFDIDDDKRLAMWQHVFNYTVPELKRRLWHPLLPVLRELGAARVVIIPDADLHSLPLAIGIADEVDAPSVMMAPSLRLYAQCAKWLREREPRENTLMMIVNPTKDLSAANLEAKLLRDLFAAHHEVVFTLTEDQATQHNVIRTSRVGNYWHFAGHAHYEEWNPSLSALLLASGEILPFYWIPMWMDLRATRLAVLSACETGITPARDPTQEFTGLFTAFLTAGVPTVLASLWPVENISTALLIHRFYQYHLGDPRANIAPRSPGDALRDAQKWLRELTSKELQQHPVMRMLQESPPPRHDPIWKQILATQKHERPFENPYYWAGFVLVGA